MERGVGLGILSKGQRSTGHCGRRSPAKSSPSGVLIPMQPSIWLPLYTIGAKNVQPKYNASSEQTFWTTFAELLPYHKPRIQVLVIAIVAKMWEGYHAWSPWMLGTLNYIHWGTSPAVHDGLD